ncbi:zinc-binding dehydrogenase [Novosphingobium sp. PS1R-30]|uniref:Zinc-binding dehydrogenase n=1 Tax=Novosphingobium anseongense TaxID=3133436 RepID=A0ABU8S2A6_9SPHN
MARRAGLSGTVCGDRRVERRIPRFYVPRSTGEKPDRDRRLLGAGDRTSRIRDAIAAYYSGIAAGQLVMPIDRVFPLSQAAEAHAHVERGHPFGRVLLHP